ncbi:hypothetical protein GCM10027446_34060 [Angustibacter peucedani]
MRRYGVENKLGGTFTTADDPRYVAFGDYRGEHSTLGHTAADLIKSGFSLAVADFVHENPLRYGRQPTFAETLNGYNDQYVGPWPTTGSDVGQIVALAVAAGYTRSRGVTTAAKQSEGAAKTVDDSLPKPQVGSQDLQNHIDALYKGTANPNRVGNGTTMDAIRNELATGVPTAGRMHSIKGQERLNGLNKWLRRNPDAPYYDRLVAQSLADELSLVLRGGG